MSSVGARINKFCVDEACSFGVDSSPMRPKFELYSKEHTRLMLLVMGLSLDLLAHVSRTAGFLAAQGLTDD